MENFITTIKDKFFKPIDKSQIDLVFGYSIDEIIDIFDKIIVKNVSIYEGINKEKVKISKDGTISYIVYNAFFKNEAMYYESKQLKAIFYNAFFVYKIAGEALKENGYNIHYQELSSFFVTKEGFFTKSPVKLNVYKIVQEFNLMTEEQYIKNGDIKELEKWI